MCTELLFQRLDTYKSLGAEYTAKEIVQQPVLWKNTMKLLQSRRNDIDVFLKKQVNRNTKIILTGAGTSEFVGNTVVPYLRRKGMQNIHSISTTNLVLSPESYIHPEDDILLVSCARSGNSPESVATVNLVEQICPVTKHIMITCNPEGALSKIAEEKNDNAYLMLLEGANDLGFAMTGSFTCMTLCALLMFQLEMLDDIAGEVQTWAGQVEETLMQHASLIADIVALKKNRIICLGSACFNGIAQEAHLKTLELSASLNTACFDTPLGFRHGPKSVLNDDSLVMMYMSSESYTRQYELDMLKELMNTAGAHYVLAISPEEISRPRDFCHAEIILPKASDDCLHMLSAIILAQAFALENSVYLGIASDNPSPSGSVNRVVQGVTVYPYK